MDLMTTLNFAAVILALCAGLIWLVRGWIRDR
jgi:hypothetical protein